MIHQTKISICIDCEVIIEGSEKVAGTFKKTEYLQSGVILDLHDRVGVEISASEIHAIKDVLARCHSLTGKDVYISVFFEGGQRNLSIESTTLLFLGDNNFTLNFSAYDIEDEI